MFEVHQMKRYDREAIEPNAAFSAIHYWLTPWAQGYWHDAAPKNFVLDEIVGYRCVPVFSVVSFTAWWHCALAFVIFRVLDAIKLPGARYVDRNHYHPMFEFC